MNTVKKIEFETLPQDFSPSTLPEILKLVKRVKGDTAFVYQRMSKPFFMETDRLIIRRFTTDDAEAVLALSLDRMNSSMKNFDHQWPTDTEGCKGATAYFAGEDIYYAVCLKPSMKLIGFIAYNSVNDDGILDLGHVWHTAYQDNDLDTEALSLMTQYAFEKLRVNGVTAGNPLDCEEQIAPLKAIGMEIIETREKASFVNDENGNPIEFTGCKMLITKEQWNANNPESYFPKNKPEILNMMEKSQEETVKIMEFGEVELVSLSKMFVASYEVTSGAPEQTAIEFVESWLQNKGLKVGENDIRGFGFDCHKGRDIPKDCRIYHVYYSVPNFIKGDSDIVVKEFPGGKFARLVIANPFTGDFPLGWGVILKWTFENNVMNKLGCTSPDDCYSLFSNEATPCLEEIYWDGGVQYMALYMPVEESNPESYFPKNKPEILNMMETVNKSELHYPPQYRIKPKIKTAAYTGAGWPHSNAYPAMFTAISLFYGKETRLNEKGEQINDDLQYRIQGALSTEAYGIQYSELFEGDHLQNCLRMYGIKTQVVDCSDWADAQVRDFVCAAVANDKTVIIEPNEYKDIHFVFGYSNEGKTLFCCLFLDGDDKKNCSFHFQKYYKRKNRTAHVKRLITLEDTGETLPPREVYRQSLKQAYRMMTNSSPRTDFTKLRGAGIGIYDAWIVLLQQANAENSQVFYMHFPVFPQFIILYENRLHFCEFLKVCAEMYGELPELMELIRKCEETQRLMFEDAELGFHRENGDPKYLTMTHNERRNLLIGILEKCRLIDKEMIALLKRVCEVL